MRDTRELCERIDALKQRNATRDQRHFDILAIRDGDYASIAGDVLPEDFDHVTVSNLIDTAARDVSEVMAPLPSFSCSTVSATSEKAKAFAEKRGRIVNSYVQQSRLQQQMFEGTDRYASFGFMALLIEPDFIENNPCIRVGQVHNAYYVRDGRGRVVEYYESSMVPAADLCAAYPEYREQIENLTHHGPQDIELVVGMDKFEKVAILPDFGMELCRVKNLIDRCPVAIIERPTITKTGPRGQFDDVIWVQIARAIVQSYTLSALEQSVNAPLAVPDDVNNIDLGPLSAIQTSNPGGIGRVRLDIPQGLFPASGELQQEQMIGSRYPEGRSGNIDASIVTGQGVQALMGTFDTQIQTFQRLATTALEDALSMALEMDEKVWPNRKKTVRIKDAGSPFEVDYIPSKDIAGDYTVDASYGAIAGLDPNRGLVFILQTLGAGLLSKDSARRYLPVELNATAEEQNIDIEEMRQSLSGSIAALAQAVPMFVSQGGDPRDIVLQISEVMELRKKGKSIEEAAKAVFAPKQTNEEVGEQNPLAALTQGGQGAAPQTPGQDLLMSIAGLTPGGNANLQANVSRRQPI